MGFDDGPFESKQDRESVSKGIDFLEISKVWLGSILLEEEKVDWWCSSGKGFADGLEEDQEGQWLSLDQFLSYTSIVQINNKKKII